LNQLHDEAFYYLDFRAKRENLPFIPPLADYHSSEA